MPLQPLASPTEHPLSRPRPSGVTERARRAAFVLPFVAALTSCRDAFAGFGSGSTATSNVEQLFGALGARHADVARNAKYEYARLQLAKGALVPSGVFEDSNAWTRSSGPVRLLEIQGGLVDGKYTLVSRIGVPEPRKPADGRHAITLSRLSDNEFRWDTDRGLRHRQHSARGVGDGARPPRRVGGGKDGARRPRRSADGRTADGGRARATVLARLHRADATRRWKHRRDARRRHTLDRLARRYPAFGDYVRRYVDPVRYRVVVSDRSGVPYFEAVARDQVMTVRMRTCAGELVPLSGPNRPMPDTLAMLVDFKAKVKHLGVGFHGLRMELVHVRHDDTENSWVVTARQEPEWEFPLATARLIRAPLRRPFAGEGSLFRIGVRRDGTGQTVIVRQVRLFVQESAILRFLNSLQGLRSASSRTGWTARRMPGCARCSRG